MKTIYISDLDGTLLQSNETTSDYTNKVIKLFCKQNGYTLDSVLKIGSGEAILASPFRLLVTQKIKKLSKSIYSKHYLTLNFTMPIPKSLFLKASTKYWLGYGQKYGTSKEDMQTMKIE